MTLFKDYGLSLDRIASIISQTIEKGGKIAHCTLRVASWIRRFHTDQEARYVIEGFAHGFDWDADEPPSYEQVPNYVPEQWAHKVTAEIQLEIDAGRVVRVRKEDVVGVAALCVVDKERSGMVKVRVVHNLSSPEGGSVNDYTTVHPRKFSTVDQACTLMRPFACMAKVDLSKAYRSIPVAPRHWRTHVFEWDGVVYSDLRLPFGNAAAPGVFDCITQVIVRYMKAQGFPGVLGYIDDFLMVCTDE